MQDRQTPALTDLEIPKQADIPDDVVPLFGQDKKDGDKPSKAKLFYDIVMLGLLTVDLLLISIDNIMMSSLLMILSKSFGFSSFINGYANHLHTPITAIGGVFTTFWVIELSIRWLRAIVKKTYYRWFFFPFVHWYEVLACFPVLRALRLLRAGVIIKNLHHIGIIIIPERFIKSAQFYYHVLLEELSDRVLLTAVDNFRAQLNQSHAPSQLITSTLDKNRSQIEQTVLSLLRTELTPKLQEAFLKETNHKLAHDIGQAVETALADTPELRKYLRLIPIAGGMIESQISHIGKGIGESVTTSVTAHLFDPAVLDKLMQEIAHGIAHINIDTKELHTLLGQVVEDGLQAFEKQIKIQQWKHKDQLPI